MENPVLEPRAERIARYKAERRRELAERFGTHLEELPSKWVRRDGKEEPEVHSHGDGSERLNGRARGVANGLEADAAAEPGHQRSGPDGGRATSSLDLAVKPGPEGNRRRTRRYLPGAAGGGRKNSERFRTQPITANEMEESSGLLDAEDEENNKADVKTDERSKMSVAAKMSLFKELEKSAAPEASAFLKPRSGSVCHERRVRRGNEHRFLTQPITCEEMVAVSAPKAALPVEADPVEPEPVEPEPVEAEPAEAEDGDENCKLSMSEKLALFNKLALPEKQQDGAQADAPPERRRQKGARYRTQPITVEEVSLLQKGPVQLPAFCLSPHLSDRQQASSVNLKPSELRLSQSRPDISAAAAGAEPGPTQQGLHRSDSEPGLRGILKRSRTEAPPPSHQHNGGTQERTDAMETPPAAAVAPRRERRAAPGGEGGSLGGAPWRQRARTRRETIACTPMRGSTELEAAQEERVRRELQDDEPQTDEITTALGHVQVTLVDDSVNRSGRQIYFQEETDSSREKLAGPQCWTNMSFEAQEVSSPTKTPIQPQWRQKSKDAEDEQPLMVEAEEQNEQEASHEAKRSLESPPLCRDDACYNNSQPAEAPTCTYEESSLQPAAAELPAAAQQEVKEEAPVEESNAPGGDFICEQSPPPARTSPPCEDAAATEGEQDLDVLCQTNTPMLTSAVAEHRRSVRPSRRTQGSRNPLRALAAREDVRQDLMGERAATEERNQAEKQRKNSSSTEDVDVMKSYPPFSSRMLLYIKGRQRVQVRLAEPSARSLNSGDCFLLVTPEHCIVWSGEFANEQEKAKAAELASLIQSQRDLGCGASHVVHLEEGLNSESSLADDFWSILGGRTQYRGAGAAEEDELFERGVVESNCVYRLVDNRLVPHEQAWASTPKNTLLDPSQALVFDFGSEVYLWHGRDVPPAKRSVALQLTHQVWAGTYDYSNCRVNPLDPTQSDAGVQPRGEGRPSWALLGVVPETSETSLFKEKFLDWTSGGEAAKEAASAKDDTQPHPPQPPSPSPDLLTPCDAKALVSGPEGDGADVQRGPGLVALEERGQAEVKTLAVDTWHVQEFDDSEVPVESTGQLHEGDAYVVRWTHSVEKTNGADDSSRCSEQNTTFFTWRGCHSSVSGRDTAAFLSIGMSNGEESQVVVPQGKEPPCFLQLFKGGLVVHRGQRESASSDAAEQAAWRLFIVRGELPDEGSLLEVECSCAGLRSRGCAVLVNGQQGAVFLWSGCKAHGNSKEVGKRAVERLTQICPPELGLSKSTPVTVQTVEEGSEPADFWSALGPMDRKAYDCMLQDPGKYNFTPRLFHLSASSGSFRAEEVQSPSRLPGIVMAMPFVQESLYSVPRPALFLLDNRLEVYLWQRGPPAQAEESSAPAGGLCQQERRCAMQTALQYCKEMNPRRPPQAYLIEEGSEPLTFTNVFPRWERKVEAHAQGDAGRLKLTLVQDALAQLTKTQYPLEQLLQSPLPEGVDPQHLEVYLSDQDFQAILEMKRDEYASLPSWQQSDLKRNKGLLC